MHPYWIYYEDSPGIMGLTTRFASCLEEARAIADWLFGDNWESVTLAI